jgi:molecular chaperone GrpE
VGSLLKEPEELSGGYRWDRKVSMPDDIIDGKAPIWGEDTEPALQLEALRDRLLRALADSENTRRRGERNVEEARKYAISEFARELLVVADNLQRALEAAEQEHGGSKQYKSLLEGVRSTERILMSVFERFGIRKIEVLGKPFDPALHEAIIEVADASHPNGTVVRVVEDGYQIQDRLLRPARVIVAKNPTNVAPTAGEAASPASAGYESGTEGS